MKKRTAIFEAGQRSFLSLGVRLRRSGHRIDGTRSHGLLLAGGILLAQLLAINPTLSAIVGGAELVMDLKLGSQDSFPSRFLDCERKIAIFAAKTHGAPIERGSDLWRSDGTAEGTFHLLHSSGSFFPLACDTKNGDAFFVVESEDFAFEDALWWTDGTPSRTIQLQGEFQVDLLFGKAAPRGHVYLEDRGLLIFSAGSTAPDQTPQNLEPWVSDGTPAGTHRLLDLNPGGGSNPTWFQDFREDVYFLAGISGSTSQALVRSDGTSDGTRVVSTGSNWLTLYSTDDWLFLVAQEPNGNITLWRSDGTDMGTQRIWDFGSSVGGFIMRFFGVMEHGVALWKVLTSDTPYSLWASDGTTAGTRRLMNIGPIEFLGDQSISSTFEELGGTAYFVADDGSTGWELWQTDGTPNGTQVAFERCPGVCSGISSPNLDLAGRRLILHIRDPIRGFEPTLSDGTSPGTLVLDICPGACDASSRVSLDAGGSILSFIRSSAGGIASATRLYAIRPWDGSHRLLTPPPLELESFQFLVADFALLPKQLLFAAREPDTGTELWTLPIKASSAIEIPTAGFLALLVFASALAVCGLLVLLRSSL